MRLPDKYKDWFEFTKKERNGILILCCLITLMIIYNFSASALFSKPPTDISGRRKEIVDWLAAHRADTLSDERDYASLAIQKEIVDVPKLFHFDPNSATTETWIQLGLREKQARSIINYVAKGGKFRVKADVAKMYVIKPELYERLYPFIDLPEVVAYDKKDYTRGNYSNTTSNQPEYKKFDYTTIVVELNSADTTELKMLKGIGSFTARKIVEYRSKLGGFRSIDQLLEIWKMTPERIDSIRGNILVDENLVTYLNINTISLEALSKHPYINSSQARSLLAYRDMHGKFKTVEDIKKSVLIDEKTFSKIRPYLLVE